MANTTKKKAEGLLDEAKGHVKDTVGGVKNDLDMQASGKVDQIAGKVQSEFADLYDSHECKLEAATSFVRERPIVSLIIASIIGLIIGRLVIKSGKKCCSK